MAKLPKKLVQAPTFDSPLRRTATPELSVVVESKESDTPDSVRQPVLEDRQETESPQAESSELCHRVTVRLSQSQWEAIQTECFRRRMSGEKINAAALVRDIVASWMARPA